MIIKGQLAQKIVQHSGIAHHQSLIRSKIRQHAASHHEGEHLIHQYEKLVHGRPMEKHEVKELLDKLRDRKFKITGDYLKTVWHDSEKLIHKAKLDIKHDIAELNEERAQEKKLEEQKDLEKVQEKEAERAALKAKMTIMPGGKTGHIPHHDGTPVSQKIGA